MFPLEEDTSIIKSWRNHYNQKSDIFIKINGKMKGISIKKGAKNSVHVERISDFIHFLMNNRIDREIVIEYLKYHFADGTTNGTGNVRITNIENLILSKKGYLSSTIHFGPLVCQPKNRCLNYNYKYDKDRFCVQLKWYSLFDDII